MQYGLSGKWGSINQQKAGRALCWHGGGAAVMLQGRTLSYFFQEVNEGCAVDFSGFSGPIDGFLSSVLS